MSKRILFFGNEKLATGVNTTAPIFRSLIKAGYQIEALIISQPPTSDIYSEPIALLAKQNGIKVLNFTRLKDAIDQISRFNVETAVLAAYGKIVPQRILDLFKTGIINIHPSLLPKHRGPTPIESVILDGEKETGISIMRLVKAMDAGPIYAQGKINLTGTESKQELADKLGVLGSQLLIENLDSIINHQLIPEDQDDKNASYDKLISKDDGIINWGQTAESIVNQIRAYAFWPKSYANISNIEATIIDAHKVNSVGKPGQIYVSGKEFGIYAADGLVVIDSLIPQGKKEMSAESFLAGYKSKLNY